MRPDRLGFSVYRIDRMRSGEIRAVFDLFAAKRHAGEAYAFFVRARAIRAIRDCGGQRVFCIIDDATDQSEAHALIRLDRSQALSKSAARRYRGTLIEVFESHSTRERMVTMENGRGAAMEKGKRSPGGEVEGE